MNRIAFGGKRATLELRDDGVLYLRWTRGIDIGEQDALSARQAVQDLCQSQRRPMLIDMVGTASLSRSARAVFTLPNAATRIALLGSSPVDRVIANYFLRREILPCPTRYFTSFNDAMTWLRSSHQPGTA